MKLPDCEPDETDEDRSEAPRCGEAREPAGRENADPGELICLSGDGLGRGGLTTTEVEIRSRGLISAATDRPSYPVPGLAVTTAAAAEADELLASFARRR